jgi:hypothetical protein
MKRGHSTVAEIPYPTFTKAQIPRGGQRCSNRRDTNENRTGKGNAED